jgi:ATP-binding cassette subfamily B protein
MKHLLRLRPLLKPYTRQVSLALATVIALTVLSLLIPVIIQQIIDVGLVGENYAYLALAGLALLVIGALRAGLGYVQRYLSEWIASHIGYDLRNALYDHIQHLPFSFHDHSQTGQLISRCIEDVRSIERFTGFGMVELIRLVLLLTGIIILLFIAQLLLAAIALIPIVPLLWITTSFGRRVGKYFLHVDNSLGELSSRVQENVSGVQVVRAFAREPYEMERFAEANTVLYQARLKVLREFSRVMPSGMLLITLSTILVLWFGGQMVINGMMTVGEVVAFNGYLILLSAPAQQLTWLVNLMGEAVAGVQRTYEILDLQPEIQSPADAIQLPTLSGQISFQGVAFQYTSQNAPTLSDISVEIQPNQVVALIGPTGSGKSSLINLIPRFYDVSQGSVSVDGYDVRQVDLVSLRRQIGIVLQTSLLFSASVAENIAFGNPAASQEEIAAAAEAAQAGEFIAELPEDYQTVVGERGVTLSGGQRQRIAIARALLMDPRILILDDSTSSVDTSTERLIQQALDHLMIGRTTLIIAHRLSTVRRADLILVMQDGRIVQRGRHTDLLSQTGLYREIYELQLRDQEQLRDLEEGLPVLDRSVFTQSPELAEIETDS